MKTHGYATILTRCMLVSAIGLLSGLAFPLPPYVPFGLGLAPLLWYHLGYLSRHAGEGISQPAVDSVYYFGFLITIGALGVTALRLGFYGIEGSFTDVAMQFGLGLLATGYAVWARIKLTASSSLLDEANLEEAMNRYVERSRELVANVDFASNSFRGYAQTILDSSEEYTTRIHENTNSEIKLAAETFRNAISGLAEEGKIALQSLRAIVNDVTFGSERQELRKSVNAMSATVRTLTSTLDKLRESSGAGASSVEEFAGGLATVGARAKDAAQALGPLGEKDGIVSKVTSAFEDNRLKVEELNLCVDVAGASVTRFSDTVSGSGSAAAAFSEQAAKATRSMQEIASVSEMITGLLESLSGLERSLQGTTGTAGQSDHALRDLTGKFDEMRSVLTRLSATLVDSTGGLKDAMLSISDELESRLRRSIDMMDLHAARASESAASFGDA